ncbi:MAG: PEP-utilizing enzyme [Burkholderiaceae bacterium]
MATSDSSIPLPPFEAPGPGFWTQDPVHFPRPVTPYFQATHPAAYRIGAHDFAAFYGLLIDGLQTAFVNGFGYTQVIEAPESVIAERFARASQVFAEKLWREQLRDWDAVHKPAAIRRHRELQAIDVDGLSAAELRDHLTTCRDHHAAMIAQHMRFTAGALLPTGDFLAHAGDWTGLPHAQLLGLLRGSANVSSGGSAEMDQLKAAFADDSAAREVLASDGDPAELLACGGDPAQVLAHLRSLPGEAGKAVNDYLELVGWRIVDGFDIAEPSALELPDALLRAINIAVFEPAPAGSDVRAQTDAVRAQVPPQHQGAFDALLHEARLTYRLRDERGVYSDIWAAGLMRRAALAAGRWAVRSGRIADASHMLEATLDEMCAVLSDSGGPDASAFASRATYRTQYTAKDAPPTLGTPAAPPADLAALPPPVARVMRAFSVCLDHLFANAQATHADAVLFGLAASKGVCEGTARRISSPSQFDRLNKGDVLVTESTSEAFNILLPLLGAIVTDNGGLLSHAAIVAREYGIPGVVGTRDATARIRDGQRIRVDGDNGEVTVFP